MTDPHPASAELGFTSAAELAEAIATSATTSRETVEQLLERIAALNAAGPELRAVLALAPDALAQADALDAELRAGQRRGPLHGVPVLVKDNIEVKGLPGSAGSLALASSPATRDAPLVTRLREAGLVVLGVTNLSEWANIRSNNSTSGWSAMGGLTRNPWSLERSAGGSSSGSGAAIAAGLTPLAIGSETDGSITCPASLNGCVGLKPTVGLLPGEGIVPISGSQDAPGPMGRSVADVALLFDALSGSATASTLGEGSLEGTTFGVAHAWLTGHAGTDVVFANVLDRLTAAGATLSDAPVVSTPDDVHEAELTVLLCELKHDLGEYLADRPGLHDGSPRSLGDVIAFNLENADRELALFGQELFEQAVTTQGRDTPGYAEARERCLGWAIGETLGPALQTPDAPDVLIAPAYSPAWVSAFESGDIVAGGNASTAPSVAGWPILCIPMALVEELPVGLVLIGRPGEEGRLLTIGAAIEKLLGLALRPAWRQETP